jgi:hypothetical protein
MSLKVGTVTTPPLNYEICRGGLKRLDEEGLPHGVT